MDGEICIEIVFIGHTDKLSKKRANLSEAMSLRRLLSFPDPSRAGRGGAQLDHIILDPTTHNLAAWQPSKATGLRHRKLSVIEALSGRQERNLKEIIYTPFWCDTNVIMSSKNICNILRLERNISKTIRLAHSRIWGVACSYQRSSTGEAAGQMNTSLAS